MVAGHWSRGRFRNWKRGILCMGLASWLTVTCIASYYTAFCTSSSNFTFRVIWLAHYSYRAIAILQSLQLAQSCFNPGLAQINRHWLENGRGFYCRQLSTCCYWVLRFGGKSNRMTQLACQCYDHGASGRSSGISMLSTAAISSTSWGSASVPAFHVTLTTVKAE